MRFGTLGDAQGCYVPALQAERIKALRPAAGEENGTVSPDTPPITFTGLRLGVPPCRGLGAVPTATLSFMPQIELLRDEAASPLLLLPSSN